MSYHFTKKAKTQNYVNVPDLKSLALGCCANVQSRDFYRTSYANSANPGDNMSGYSFLSNKLFRENDLVSKKRLIATIC